LKPTGFNATSITLSASPASNGGRGLKPRREPLPRHRPHASPASNGGRGLKLGGQLPLQP